MLLSRFAVDFAVPPRRQEYVLHLPQQRMMHQRIRTKNGLGGTKVGGGKRGEGPPPPSPSPPPQSRTKLTYWPCMMLHNTIFNILYIYSFIYRPHPPIQTPPPHPPIPPPKPTKLTYWPRMMLHNNILNILCFVVHTRLNIVRQH